jgi:hypothetical protein
MSNEILYLEGPKSDEINFRKISLKKFRNKGYLQELNRQFLNPLGLSIAFSQYFDEDEEYFGCISDFRENTDLKIALIDVENCTEDKLEEHRNKAKFIEEEFKKRRELRLEKLGYEIEPIPEKKEDISNQN